MKIIHSVVPLLGCTLFFFSGICLASQSSTSESEPTPIKQTKVSYVVAILDRITITHSDESVDAQQVTQEGTITLDGKNFKAVGLTPAELRNLIRRHVSGISSITIDEFRTNRISVLGEVYHQILTEMNDGPMRVMDAIAAANGFTPLANLRRVKLVRENAGEVTVYELDLRKVMKGEESGQNILLKPGDVITVPRNFL